MWLGDLDERALGMGLSVGMCGTAGRVGVNQVTNERGTTSTNVRGTWPSRVPGTAKPGTGTRGSSPSVLRRTARSRTSTGISKSRRTTTLGGRGTSSPSGAQRMAASSSISGVQSLISWANQLGKQTKCNESSSLSNGKAKTASQEIDSVDSLPGQATSREMHQ